MRAAVTVFSEPIALNDMPAWKRRRTTGGGVLFDLASHHVDLLRWFLDDEVAKVEARLKSEVTDDDTAWLRIAMRGGAEARSFFSFRTGRADFLEFIGEAVPFALIGTARRCRCGSRAVPVRRAECARSAQPSDGRMAPHSMDPAIVRVLLSPRARRVRGFDQRRACARRNAERRRQKSRSHSCGRSLSP